MLPVLMAELILINEVLTFFCILYVLKNRLINCVFFFFGTGTAFVKRKSS